MTEPNYIKTSFVINYFFSIALLVDHMSSLREDRFFSSAPFATQEAFINSRFHELYNKTHRHPDAETVIDWLCNLPGGSENFRKVISEIEFISSEHDVIRVYTSNFTVGSQKFYNYINEQLCKDNSQTLCYLMPLIRRATYQINCHPPPKDCVAYRGMELNFEQRKYFKIGTIFRFPGFTATSKSKKLAEGFGNTLFEIHVYAGCLQVRDVSDISHFPAEEEYLFSPYSLFEVTDKRDGMIVLRSIDNMSDVGMDYTNLLPKDNSLAYSSPDLNWSTPNKPITSSDNNAFHHQSIASNFSTKTTSHPSSNIYSSPKNKSTQLSDKYVPHHQSVTSSFSKNTTSHSSSSAKSSSKDELKQSSDKFMPYRQSVTSSMSRKITSHLSPSLKLPSKEQRM
jgi:hypothetical protein